MAAAPVVGAAEPARPPARAPFDAAEFRALGHALIDDVAAELAALPSSRVWTPMPDDVRAALRAPASSVEAPTPLAAVLADYQQLVAPFHSGNRHPGFMAWAQGGATPVGALAELLCGALNMNCGGRDHAGVAVERQVAAWVAEWLGFPSTAAGVFVTGASAANAAAVHAARCAALGPAARTEGGGGARLRAYTSAGAHSCVARAVEMAGIGGNNLIRVPLDAAWRMDVGALRRAVAADRAAGLTPFLLVGTAGSVDVGAFDDLDALADVAAEEGLWLHVDGAFGALAALSREHAHRVAGLARARSVALDFHKFSGVPYDAGFLLAADVAALRAAFATPAAYLARESVGLAAGGDWPVDLGPDLSRGARGLKAWIVLRARGSAAIGESIDAAAARGKALAARVGAEADLELLAYAGFNIVCFRYAPAAAALRLDLDALNRAVVVELHLEGRVAPSVTTLSVGGGGGGTAVAVRAALFNGDTSDDDLDALIEGVLRIGAAKAGEILSV